ncbi:hypothetical protein BLOT_015833 [Blomia tropicalis]|nr:hypothetical protein BLOT_015833 [Blomia tropicalis]
MKCGLSSRQTLSLVILMVGLQSKWPALAIQPIVFSFSSFSSSQTQMNDKFGKFLLKKSKHYEEE